METEEAAPEEESVPGQIFLSHTSLDYPHDDPVERHIIEEVWRQLSEDRGLPVFLDTKVLRSGVQLRQRLCEGIYIRLIFIRRHSSQAEDYLKCKFVILRSLQYSIFISLQNS